jgi:GAF domain-containing protein
VAEDEPTFGDMARRVADLEARLAKSERDRAAVAEELQQNKRRVAQAADLQAAASEVLQLISAHPGELAVVLEGIVSRAVTLCEADAGAAFVQHGDVMRIDAAFGTVEADIVGREFDSSRMLLSRRALVSQEPVYVKDYLATQVTDPALRALGEEVHVRSVILIPMFYEEEWVGQINVFRRSVREFDANQAAILRAFGEHAAIAFANARLFNECRTATER